MLITANSKWWKSNDCRVNKEKTICCACLCGHQQAPDTPLPPLLQSANHRHPYKLCIAALIARSSGGVFF